MPGFRNRNLSEINMKNYLVFDIETIPDGDLLLQASRFIGPKGEKATTTEEAVAYAKACALKRSEGESDFIPLPYHRTVAACSLTLDEKFVPIGVSRYWTEKYAPARRTVIHGFWREVNRLTPVLVSFNGRGFDLPVLELEALREGIPCIGYFTNKYGPRNRFGDFHVDLFEFFTNYGACRLYGGLDALAKMVGLPGKISTTGEDVEELYKRSDLKRVSDYCLEDVLNTYFLFLRTRLIVGALSWDEFCKVVDGAFKFLTSESAVTKAFVSRIAPEYMQSAPASV